MTYERDASAFRDFGLGPGVLERALDNPSDPAATWEVLRGLCRHIRHNSDPGVWPTFGSLPRLRQARRLAAGEVELLHRQKAARRDLTFVGSQFHQIMGER